MKKFLTFFVLMTALSIAGPLFGHHGRGNAYDRETERTLEGRYLKSLAWRNPHVVIYGGNFHAQW